MNNYELEVQIKRLQRKLRKKEDKIAAMEKYIRQLEGELAKKTLDFPKLMEKTVERALANVRLVPVIGLGDKKIIEINTTTVDKRKYYADSK